MSKDLAIGLRQISDHTHKLSLYVELDFVECQS